MTRADLSLVSLFLAQLCPVSGKSHGRDRGGESYLRIEYCWEMLQSVVQTIFGLVISVIQIAMFTWFCYAIGSAFESNAHETDPYRRHSSDTGLFSGGEIGGIIGFILGVAFTIYWMFFI